MGRSVGSVRGRAGRAYGRCVARGHRAGPRWTTRSRASRPGFACGTAGVPAARRGPRDGAPATRCYL